MCLYILDFVLLSMVIGTTLQKYLLLAKCLIQITLWATLIEYFLSAIIYWKLWSLTKKSIPSGQKIYSILWSLKIWRVTEFLDENFCPHWGQLNSSPGICFASMCLFMCDLPFFDPKVFLSQLVQEKPPTIFTIDFDNRSSSSRLDIVPSYW